MQSDFITLIRYDYEHLPNSFDPSGMDGPRPLQMFVVSGVKMLLFFLFLLTRIQET